MISFFPTPYPDELWYSVICRYHVHSGNYCAKHTLRQLYGDNFCAPQSNALRAYKYAVGTASAKGSFVCKGCCNAAHILSLLRAIFPYSA